MAISTLTPPEYAQSDYQCPSIYDSDSSDNSNDEQNKSQGSELVTSLIDRVSGRIIKKIVHEDAARPIHSTIVENHIVLSYWNCRVIYFYHRSYFLQQIC